MLACLLVPAGPGQPRPEAGVVGVGCRGSPWSPGLFRVVGHQGGPFPALGGLSLLPLPPPFCLPVFLLERGSPGRKQVSLPGLGVRRESTGCTHCSGAQGRGGLGPSRDGSRGAPHTPTSPVRLRQRLRWAGALRETRQPLGRLLCGCLAGGSGAAKSIFCINYVSCYCSLGVALL